MELDDFIRNNLKPLLNNDVDDEIIAYIKDMKSTEDFDEFIANIIDRSITRHVKICDNLKAKLFSEKRQAEKAAKDGNSTLRSKKGGNSGEKKSKSNANNGKKSEIPMGQKPQSASNKKGSVTHPSGSSKKGKNVNVDTYNFKLGPKQGRQPCNCEARDHPLINNCLKCGRIVCAQEGSGPCFFCDTLVCTNEEFHILESNSNLSDKLHSQLFEQKTSKEWKKAIEARDKLVRADRDGEDRRKIYDEQSEYYSSDGWNVGDKSNVPKIHKSAKDMKLALDFASRTVVSETKEKNKNRDSLLAAVNTHLDATEKRLSESLRVQKWDDIVSKVYSDKNQLYTPSAFSKVKVANDAFLEEIDRGMCLSMHQPWASLLVAGIKIHEGRTWYTEHRGRLWIHAASKEPNNDELLEVEQMYRAIYNNQQLVFPKKYPTSCLLGCVFVEDCLSQDQYREIYATGESESPYVLICSKPMILPLFHSMQGQHKIFPLSKEIHNIARESLMSSKWL
ncbi:hypothetical protein PPYR_02253 [Photinus pyralis]|uniref:ASCH domain-containing protein n=1 Tax=Photinus pyralis TaxID=7054 RepID=A0A5N4B6W2_PHOPY|nr:activating signal cointegrator 1 [Photinus pyralis]KAB0805283.1 hypothetical protein PPYR_02253 [Photinus pyralis]